MSTIVCPTCQTSIPQGDRFCEVCGTPLATIAASIGQPTGFAGSLGSIGCQKCGAPAEAISEDGYCNLCGFRNRPIAPQTLQASIPPLRISLSPSLAGVSDRGLRYPQNEDHLALWQTEQQHVLVVCDGVSSSNEPQLAAQTASQVACEVLQETLFTALDPTASTLTGDTLHRLMEDAIQTAIAQAHQAVAQLVPQPDREDNPPSTTIVAAAVSHGIATIGWVGDSRAYWIAHESPPIAQQLTTDHSWLNDQIQAGKLSLMEARSNPKAHAITRWLGADAELEKAETVRFSIASAGYLLLCSDGLWNYLSDADHLSHLIAREIDAATIAQRLVDYANAKGGRDNITVAVLKVT